MADTIPIRCAECGVIREHDPFEGSTCPACGDTIRPNDGKLLHPVPPDEAAAWRAGPSPEEAERAAAMRAVLDRVEGEDAGQSANAAPAAAAPAASADDAEASPPAMAGIGFALIVAALPISGALTGVHDLVGIATLLLLGIAGVRALWVGIGGWLKLGFVGTLVVTVVALNVAVLAGLGIMGALGMTLFASGAPPAADVS